MSIAYNKSLYYTNIYNKNLDFFEIKNPEYLNSRPPNGGVVLVWDEVGLYPRMMGEGGGGEKVLKRIQPFGRKNTG
jgi:hypothetical protein